ncbi:MFS transporter [Amycolatopsis sp. YIM 10]|uniref:MFS transporter n=1 Tax=Amycolatopsis sp. YIM 10 TaxID=2653857 RepID=UPI0012902C49|nr:MFS transporter [Amycolatopsis sp. YIM 10]QFU88408.1 Antiseptic resistance protein [Amycolatopsis sp. YIM 10]
MPDRQLEISAGPREWLGLAVLVLPTALLSMDATVLYLALPSLAAELAPSPGQLLWISDAYGFLVAGFLVTMGTLGDRIGRRRLLLIGAAAFLVTSVLAAFAPTAGLLIVARGLLGIAGATLMPSTLALIGGMFRDPRQRGTAIGLWSAGLSGGVALGPIAGGLLLEWFWWGSVFLLAVPVMVLLLLTGPFLLPEHRDPEPGKLDLASVALSLAAVLPVVYGIKHLAEGGSALPGGIALALGAGAGVVFLRRQRRLSVPLIDLRLFAARPFRNALVVLLGALACVAGVYLFAALYLQQEAALSPIEAGLWLVPSAAAMVLTSVAAPALTRRLPVHRVLAWSLVVAALGFLVLAWTSGIAPLVIGLVLIYLGLGPVMALSTDIVVSAAPPDRAGAASALSETSVEFGLALGVAVLGSVGTFVQSRHDFTTGLTAVAAIGVAVLLAMAALTGRSRRA